MKLSWATTLGLVSRSVVYNQKHTLHRDPARHFSMVQTHQVHFFISPTDNTNPSSFWRNVNLDYNSEPNARDLPSCPNCFIHKNPSPAVQGTQAPKPSVYIKVSKDKSNSAPKSCATAALAQPCTRLPLIKRPAVYILVQSNSKPSGLSH